MSSAIVIVWPPAAGGGRSGPVHHHDRRDAGPDLGQRLGIAGARRVSLLGNLGLRFLYASSLFIAVARCPTARQNTRAVAFGGPARRIKTPARWRSSPRDRPANMPWCRAKRGSCSPLAFNQRVARGACTAKGTSGPATRVCSLPPTLQPKICNSRVRLSETPIFGSSIRSSCNLE